MKGTEAENVLPRLFSGKVRTYISCINVDYESARSEEFWDIQLNVSGNKNVEDSFRDYVAVEVMNGENQYFAGDNFKLQDAKKGVIFESFPEVLHLQLKRFQYDIERDAMMKINDRYEFPESFDAGLYLSEKADMSEPWIYQLHGVLVHSGDLNAGHYYAFIKPNKDGWFYKYDDDKVTKATMREVLEDNYGGEYVQPNGVPHRVKGKPVMRQNSAYMLVYIRQSRVDSVLLPVTQEDTPPHLQKKLDQEAALRELRRKEREEQHLYLGVRVITEDTFQNHGGTDLTVFDYLFSEDPAAARDYRLLRRSTVKELAATVGEDIGVDPRKIRFWCMVNRQNKTVRPDTPIADFSLTIEEAHQRLAGSKGQDLRLWCEVAEDVNADGEPFWPATPGAANAPRTDLIVLFLKYFDVDRQQLRGISHIYISREKKVEDLVPAILKKMNWPEKSANGERTVLKLFEEIKPNMIEPMKAKQSLKAAELQDGDIVCFQLAPSGSDAETPSIKSRSPSSKSSDSVSTMSDKTLVNKNPDRIESAPAFYDFLLHKREVWFNPHPTRNANPEQFQPFSMILSSKQTYDQVAAKIGERLGGVDPTHLRFWTVNATHGTPKVAVKRGQSQNLQTILSPPYSTYSNNNQRNNALMFEVLDMSLTELDTKKALKVIWLSDGISKVDSYDILVPKNGTVEDLVNGLIKKAQLEDEETAGPIDIYEIYANKIHKELARDYQVISIVETMTIVAERCPQENLEEEADNQLIEAFHFQGEANKSHGIPFKFRIFPGEKFAETRKRLEKRTGIKGKNFEKIKFALVRRGGHYPSKPMYLTDDSVLSELITSQDDKLGLDHVDRSRVIRNGAGDLFLK